MFFISPFSVNNVKGQLQIEIIKLRCNTLLKTKYDDVGIPEFYKYLGMVTLSIKSHCAKILSMFGSNYVCEQLFNVMKLNKSKSAPS